MSLLIKALATAEKDKQAELKKKRAAGSVTDDASPLSLEPLSAKDQTSATETSEAGKSPEWEKPELGFADDVPADGNLSLQQESGLAEAVPTTNGHMKSKAVDNKTTSKVTTKAEETKSKNKTEAFNAAAAASVAGVKSQSVSAKDSSQKAAANVFVANQSVKSASSKSALILLGVAGALMIWLGLQGYQYIRALTAPEVVVIKPAPLTPQVAANTEIAPSDQPAVLQSEEQALSANEKATTAVTEAQIKNTEEIPKSETVKAADVHATETSLFADDGALVAEGSVIKQSLKKQPKYSKDNPAESSDTQYQNSNNTTRTPPLKLISRTPDAGVDPTLLAAYQAFSRGDDAAAQQQYRQVLQVDVRNVDALLGMAAIAQRQGRDADANGWYQKVLEIEPRNTIAQSAITNLQMNADLASSNSAATDLVGTESRIKNMLAQQPGAANLHAALGNLFAAQNQWAAAQEAYFNASRLAPNNADYVFNLAVSLDQLGKPGLALTQYQRALELLNMSGAASPDRAQLEARINALR